MKSRNYERVEKLFTRCLVKVLNIELWRTYLGYVKETKGSLPSYREKMAQAYDFALDKMGMDIMSYPIWNDYITFLKNVEAVGSYAENQRITAVRKVYQRGIVNPMTNIEQLWKDYVNYEQGINPIIADKMIQDRSRDYMNARRVAKEYEAVTRGLNRNAPSTPPQGLPEEIKQINIKCINFFSVMFAYEQCLLCLGHHPDIWYEAALFLEQSSKLLTEKGDPSAGKLFSEEASDIYERATTSFLRTNMLLHFAYADFEEGRMKYEKVHQIYNKFIDNPEIDPTLAYLQYMKFARRAEGIKAARTIFKKTRENPKARYHVYVAAAWMEYYCSKDKTVAFKIFELGLKKYGDNPDYILCYIDYLSHLNDDNNTRVLFERVLSSGSLPPERQIEIWNKFLEFESNVGDLASILKVEKRRAAVIEQLKEFEGKETALLVDRYKFQDLYPCSASELKSIGYKEIAKQHVSNLPSSMPQFLEDDKDRKPPFPTPDPLQMIPYKPRQICPTAAHPMPGGVFPPPPSASFLMTILPPPTSFQGPFVKVDDLVKIIKQWRLPENAPKMENGISKDMEKYFEHAINAMSENKKRKIGVDGMDESDEEDGGIAPPVKDVYRARQQKKVK
ncbi:UNVERIFIED_CONTAM: Cleavage stimulation factor subunit 3 [Trichonephila clavipes]